MTPNRCRAALALALTPLLAELLPAQFELRISEVLVDPVGPNARKQTIELHNPSNRPYSLANHRLVLAPQVLALPAIAVPGDGIARLHLGRPGTNSQADIYLPNARELTLNDDVALFRSANTTTSADLHDYLAWSDGVTAGKHRSISLAVQARQWPSTLVWIPIDPRGDGRSVAHFWTTHPSDDHRPETWYEDGTPTLGLRNDPGELYVVGAGCPNASNTPLFGSGALDNRPWIGETWKLNLQSPAPTGPGLVVFGRPIAPRPLDSIGMQGCFQHVAFDVLIPTRTAGGFGEIRIRIPRSNIFLRAEVRGQFFAPAPLASNSLKVLVSRELLGIMGSR